ncbi:MAG: hypothetical protein M1827_007213 [Pycnora praestabilis]|nr:MAG: hypothetical protein M1827_007213 [Pycnora praestabilis]
MELKNIAIVGPGGNVGSAIIKALLRDGTFNITAITRPASTYTSATNGTPTTSNTDDNTNTVTTTTADFSSSTSLTHALQNQDALLCCVPAGATKFALQKIIIDAAIEAGVKLFFASEFVSDVCSDHYEIFPKEFVGEKKKVRLYLDERAGNGDIGWTALNGGPFFDMWLTKGHAGFNIPARRAKIYGTGNNLSCWTPLPTVAAAVVQMLHDPKPILNRGVFISGVKGVTQNAILEALEFEMDDQFEVEYVDLRPIKEDALEALAKGMFKAATMGLAISFNFNEEDSKANFWDKVENELLDVQPVSVREAVRAAMIEAGMGKELKDGGNV